MNIAQHQVIEQLQQFHVGELTDGMIDRLRQSYREHILARAREVASGESDCLTSQERLDMLNAVEGLLVLAMEANTAKVAMLDDRHLAKLLLALEDI
jgi:hypothetical protein